MFNLTDSDLNKSILGCGDGPASFNAELSKRGGRIISIDPLYQFGADELRSRICQAYDAIMSQVEKYKDRYVWKSIPSIRALSPWRALGQIRMEAMNTFIADYEKGKSEGRYIPGSLPALSFRNKQFDIALCSHYLFLYSEQVDLDQHIASIKELCRVAAEVRIYPLLSLEGELSPHLDEVVAALPGWGLVCSKVNVAYQFQKGATHMLVVTSSL